jgi:hypothetical protein
LHASDREKRNRSKSVCLAVWLLLATVALLLAPPGVPEAQVAVTRVFIEYFSGLPGGSDWEKTSSLAEGVDKEIVTDSVKEIKIGSDVYMYMCVGWINGYGDVPIKGETNRVTFKPTKAGSLTWVYKRAYKVSVDVDPFEQEIYEWGGYEPSLLVRSSVHSDGTEGNGPSYFPSISSDGHFVAFGSESDASNLVANDTWEKHDVFVRDLQKSLTERISVNSQGTRANESSNHPSISSDGRFVAFSSLAHDLIYSDNNGVWDIYIHYRGHESPSQLWSDSDWVSISTGSNYTLAIKQDGGLWAWGYNGEGQLALGDITDRIAPDQVQPGTRWTSVTTGTEHTLAIKTDGTLWAWGDNAYGQIVDLTTTTVLEPKEIMNRGNRRETIFLTDKDRRVFLAEVATEGAA